MAHQTQYPDRMVVGFAGMLSDTGYFDNDSMTVVTADVPFGSFVAYGTADRTCRPLAAGDTRIAGAVIRVQGGDPESLDNFKVGETASVMKKGRMFVPVSTAVVAGEDAHAILADSTAANTGGIVVGVFETSAASGDLAVVRLT